ncbi:Glyoxalase 3 [Vanrija pseudolonga]|uniref:D-lactate dehydratase n=1 Tax=Vanrija pseudolonga TaxID=143232 RepID=A0AAF1BH36_9TREE|nr:Glyoxalase 3 [Vanrija pseudolonga]
MSTKHIVHVVSNVSHYGAPNEGTPTGLWLGELSEAYHEFAAKGYKQTLVSPAGGKVPIEPNSLGPMGLEATSKAWLEDPIKMALLENTKAPADINAADVDAIYFTGGHAVMYDFTDSEPVHKLTADIWARGGVVSSVCHGYCGLLKAKLADGSLLIAGKKITGFSWEEEILAGVEKKVPYDAEALAKKNGAQYEKAAAFTSHAVVDGKLVTGQNPQSATATAQKVIEVLEGSA